MSRRVGECGQLYEHRQSKVRFDLTVGFWLGSEWGWVADCSLDFYKFLHVSIFTLNF